MSDGFDISLGASVDRLNMFHCSAVVDRIDIFVWSNRKTQPFHLKRRLAEHGCAFCHARGDDGHQFKVDFNAVPSFSNLIDALRDADIDVARPIPVEAMEVAIDAWPRTPGDLMAMHQLFVENVICLGPGLRKSRFSKGRLYTLPLESYSQMRRLVEDGYTFYCGDDGDPVEFKIYSKITDNKKPLPSKHWRLRHELTFNFPKGSMSHLLGLDGFRFEELAELLPVFCPKDMKDVPAKGKHPIWSSLAFREANAKLHVEASPRIAEWAPLSRFGLRRKRSRLLRANSFAQSRLVYEPLRALSRRWSA